MWGDYEQKQRKKIDCFVIMPITVPKSMIDDHTYEDDKHFKYVYDYLIKPVIIENGWNPIFPKTKGSEIIIAETIQQLIKSEMSVCDISILNPNVFYEAGIRTALNKPIAYIKDDNIKDIPFDTSGINHETYRKSLSAYHVDDDKEKLKLHFKETYKKSNNENPAWKKFGLQIKAEKPVTPENPTNAKINLIMDKIQNLENLISYKTTFFKSSDSIQISGEPSTLDLGQLSISNGSLNDYKKVWDHKRKCYIYVPKDSFHIDYPASVLD